MQLEELTLQITFETYNYNLEIILVIGEGIHDGELEHMLVILTNQACALLLQRGSTSFVVSQWPTYRQITHIVSFDL